MIRKMQAGDLDQILTMEEKCFPNGAWNRAQYLYELQEQRAVGAGGRRPDRWLV